MKLGPDVLVEIVAIVQKGLFEQVDISEELRAIDVTPGEDGETVELTDDYIDSREDRG